MRSVHFLKGNKVLCFIQLSLTAVALIGRADLAPLVSVASEAL
jgi:hypothetical protein